MTETADRETTAPVVRTVHVRCAPDRAFALFTDRITDWWPLQRFGLFEAETARRVVRGRAGRRAVDVGGGGRLGRGAGVVAARAGSRSRGIPGTPPEDATVVEVEFPPTTTAPGWC